ncbi:MAG: hypothetical protein GY729_01325, partial [Desulfobacteraceae bacterium]|nr:hypothetical protein [Desulfobacteraceae bacterium]
LGDVDSWYFPVELFHRLNEIDSKRQEISGKKLIQSVKYIPSSQRKLFSQLKLLTPHELDLFNTIIREGTDSVPIHLKGLAIDRQILILDCLLSFQQYRIIAEKPDLSHGRQEIKNQILLARLQRPIGSIAPFKISELKSPALGSRPMETGFSIGFDSDHDSFLRLNFSPYKKERVGENSMQGNELVLVDLAVGIDDNEVFIDRFDLIRILSLNTFSVEVEDENLLSWELRLGADRVNKHGKDRLDGVLSVGAGRSLQLNDRVTGYGMLELSAHSISPEVQFRPHLGLRFDYGNLKTWVYGGVESVSYDPDFQDIWGGKIHFQINDRYAVQAEFSNELSSRASIGICRYW